MLDKVREDFQKNGMLEYYVSLVDWSIFHTYYKECVGRES